jgi:hypothetical protein
MPLRIGDRLDDGAGSDHERRTSRMQIEKGVRHRKQNVIDIGDDLLRRRAERVTGKGAIEIEVVDR